MSHREGEFRCADCGIDVFVIGGAVPHDSLCAECRVIRQAKPEDQATLRKIFKKETGEK